MHEMGLLFLFPYSSPEPKKRGEREKSKYVFKKTPGSSQFLWLALYYSAFFFLFSFCPRVFPENLNLVRMFFLVFLPRCLHFSNKFRMELRLDFFLSWPGRKPMSTSSVSLFFVSFSWDLESWPRNYGILSSFSQGHSSHPGKADNGSVCLYLAFIPFVSKGRISLWFVWAFQKAYLLIQRGASLMPWRMQAKFICAWKYTIMSRPIWCSGPISRLIWLLCVLSCCVPKKWLLFSQNLSSPSLLYRENRARNSDQDDASNGKNEDHIFKLWSCLHTGSQL